MKSGNICNEMKKKHLKNNYGENAADDCLDEYCIPIQNGDRSDAQKFMNSGMRGRIKRIDSPLSRRCVASLEEEGGWMDG